MENGIGPQPKRRERKLFLSIQLNIILVAYSLQVQYTQSTFPLSPAEIFAAALAMMVDLFFIGCPCFFPMIFVSLQKNSEMSQPLCLPLYGTKYFLQRDTSPTFPTKTRTNELRVFFHLDCSTLLSILPVYRVNKAQLVSTAHTLHVFDFQNTCKILPCLEPIEKVTTKPAKTCYIPLHTIRTIFKETITCAWYISSWHPIRCYWIRNRVEKSFSRVTAPLTATSTPACDYYCN